MPCNLHPQSSRHSSSTNIPYFTFRIHIDVGISKKKHTDTNTHTCCYRRHICSIARFCVHLYQFVPYCNVQRKKKKKKNETGCFSVVHECTEFFLRFIRRYLGWNMMLVCFQRISLDSRFSQLYFESAFVKSTRTKLLMEDCDNLMLSHRRWVQCKV